MLSGYLLIEKRIRAVIPIFTQILIFGLQRDRILFVIRVAFYPRGQIAVGAAQVCGQIIPEFFGGLGEPVVIVPAPRLVYTVYAPGGAMGMNLSVLPRAHALLEEADDRTVFRHILIPRRCDTGRLCEPVSIADDGLQRPDRLVHDPVALGVHLVQQLFVLLI